jgi:hypothetical protein
VGLRDSVFRHPQRLAPDALSTRQPGDRVVRLTEDIEIIEGLIASGRWSDPGRSGNCSPLRRPPGGRSSSSRMMPGSLPKLTRW